MLECKVFSSIKFLLMLQMNKERKQEVVERSAKDHFVVIVYMSHSTEVAHTSTVKENLEMRSYSTLLQSLQRILNALLPEK